MKTLFALELKKLTKKRMNIIVITVCLILAGILFYLPVGQFIVLDTDGKQTSGMEAIAMDKEFSNSNAGKLTNEKIKADIAKYHPFDLLASFLPAGTLSGAPKIRAMEIIEELEEVRRGLYGGATGYVDFSGDMDFCITIRTMIKKGREVYLQAGAGIVADSVPEKEYQECCNKVMALARTLLEEENL